jgi:predicted O-methyltransferase YrrM
MDIMMDNFIEYNGWFDDSYKEFLRGRFPTMRIALNLLFQIDTHRILETGSTCRFNDSGSGYSTHIFGDFVSRYDGHLTTIDIDPNVIDACKVITKRFEKAIDYICEDSLSALAKIKEPIDLLYLDSMDAPETGDASDCQLHALKEFQMAEHLLHGKSIILLDDNDMENGGKTRIVKQYIREKGWREIFDSCQSVWIR